MAQDRKKTERTVTGRLYTLTKVSQTTGISMPTLQRYKRLYQSRIPSEGKGRKQRYPKEAMKIFEELKTENMRRRGRPAKKRTAGTTREASQRRYKQMIASEKRGAATTRLPTSGRGGGDEGYLTLTEIGKRTGISYPTLLRYVKMHLRSIPHRGTGRTRRFKPEAVAVFQRLRRESPRGRRKLSGGVTSEGVASSPGVEQKIVQLEKQILALEKALKRPMRVTISRG